MQQILESGALLSLAIVGMVDKIMNATVKCKELKEGMAEQEETQGLYPSVGLFLSVATYASKYTGRLRRGQCSPNLFTSSLSNNKRTAYRLKLLKF